MAYTYYVYVLVVFAQDVIKCLHYILSFPLSTSFSHTLSLSLFSLSLLLNAIDGLKSRCFIWNVLQLLQYVL